MITDARTFAATLFFTRTVHPYVPRRSIKVSFSPRNGWRWRYDFCDMRGDGRGAHYETASEALEAARAYAGRDVPALIYMRRP